ncbi:MAG: hypothetical protein WC044_14825 [Crocinitomicaceae bacterium]
MIETYKINGWEDDETGMLLFENDNWILVKHIPVDYQIDGFKIYRKNWVESRNSGEKEALIERVLKLKKVSSEIPDIKLDSPQEILTQIESKYGLFEFQDDDGDELFYGKFDKIDDDDFTINMIDSTGEIIESYEFDFSFEEIRSITFETGYFESIRLLMNDNLK